ncbi:hypothetical protein EPN87_00970 [archaeon]|nr:MAG: hypothetical protein EPN87_00970 [archaeon]
MLYLDGSLWPSGKLLEKETILMDMDGVACGHVDNEHPEMMKTVKPLPYAREFVEEKHNMGHLFYILTARTYEHAPVTLDWFRKWRFPIDGVIFNKPRGGNYHYFFTGESVRATRFDGVFDTTYEKHNIQAFSEVMTKPDPNRTIELINQLHQNNYVCLMTQRTDNVSVDDTLKSYGCILGQNYDQIIYNMPPGPYWHIDDRIVRATKMGYGELRSTIATIRVFRKSKPTFS